MKIVVNKKLSEIHWSAFVAAGLCFVASFFIYKEYKEEKYLMEYGFISKAVVSKIPTNCNQSSRMQNSVAVSIIATKKENKLQIDYETCNNISLGDTFEIRFSNTFDRIVQNDNSIIRTSRVSFFFAVFSFLWGVFFLLFGNNRNRLFQTPQKNTNRHGKHQKL